MPQFHKRFSAVYGRLAPCDFECGSFAMVKPPQVCTLHLPPFLLVAILLVSQCACDARIDGLQRQLQETNKSLENLRKEVEELKGQSSWDQFTKDAEKIAYLTPGDSGYSVLKTDFGTLTVTLVDIKPYANGSRVTFRFGNPTSASLLDVSATIEWGSVDDKGSPRNDEAKSKDFPFNKSFEAGHWTTVEAVLEGTPPAGLGFVRIRDLKNKAIRLYE